MADSVLVLAQDLIWSDRLGRAVTEAGGDPRRITTEPALVSALAGADAPALLIVDLTAHAYDPFAAIALAHAAGVHILAVGQHDDVPQRKRAMAAGAARVLAYRKLFEDGPATIAAWMARAVAPASAGLVT